MTSNKNVSAMAWNRKNSDLLAVGYGPFEYNDQRDGLVCCWSIKNQDVIHSDHALLSICTYYVRHFVVSRTILSHTSWSDHCCILCEVSISLSGRICSICFCIPIFGQVGLFDGTVDVYDVQSNTDKPLLDTEYVQNQVSRLNHS